MKTSASNKKIREIITMVKEEKLKPRPEFQRRLVWSRNDKNLFLDSVLRGMPFPEIYFADGDVDLETGEGCQHLVDGLQRVVTLIQYFEGDDDLKLTLVPPYRNLPEAEKKSFLQYDVAVRDLGAISRDQVVDVFKRLNATKYSLNDIEINNAVYAGALKLFCERVGDREFFRSHNTFTSTDYKRMGDLRYVLGIVGTMLQGYFNRDDGFEDLLGRFNDEFPHEAAIQVRLDAVFQFIDECGFDGSSRVWKKADLFTLMVELDQLLFYQFENPQPSIVLDNITAFHALLEGDSGTRHPVAETYYKAALQATNDRVNRMRRGVVVSGVLRGLPLDEIFVSLRAVGLV